MSARIPALILLSFTSFMRAEGAAAENRKTACDAFQVSAAEGPIIDWSAIQTKEEELSCFYLLASNLRKEELVDWLRANGFKVTVIPIRRTTDRGEIVSASWSVRKNGPLSPASIRERFANGQSISFRYEKGRDLPSITSSYSYI
jgi:hypothetical protein